MWKWVFVHWWPELDSHSALNPPSPWSAVCLFICLCMPTQALSAINFFVWLNFFFTEQKTRVYAVLELKKMKDFNVYFELNHKMISVLNTTFMTLFKCFSVTKQLPSHVYAMCINIVITGVDLNVKSSLVSGLHCHSSLFAFFKCFFYQSVSFWNEQRDDQGLIYLQNKGLA